MDLEPNSKETFQEEKSIQECVRYSRKNEIGPQVYVCFRCKQKYPNEDEIKIHMMNVHNIGKRNF